MKKALIIGAGPAGLTAAYELLDKADDIEVIVLEASHCLGGISKTVNHNGNRMDMGGHRFFSKVPEVNAWWEKMLPTQGALPYDDQLLGRTSTLSPGGPDPETDDRVMLRRNRLSRIYFNCKFFDYPISLKWDTIRNMGLSTTFVVGMSYLKSVFYKRRENSLEDFYINRFGRKLYSMFFERYTENLWGIHPREISPEWGAQRVKGLSIAAILKDVLGRLFHQKNRRVETSLIEEFAYPKLGPGQLWELTAQEILRRNGQIIMNANVVSILRDADNRVTGVVYENEQGEKIHLEGDYVLSSMPIKDLVAGMHDVPAACRDIADGLMYRDYMTLGVLISHMKLENKTKVRTIGNIVPDNWVYVHDKNVQMGRFQIYNNWSPYMVKDVDRTVWIGLEYFCNEGDRLWSMTDEEFARLGVEEMVRMGLIDSAAEVLDCHAERVKKAYPAYFGAYDRIDELRAWLDTIPNLFCIGRNGQHRYNNIDHSMCTAFEAVKNILSGTDSKENIWKVNTEQEYHEENKAEDERA
ncbi:MAG: NAD(P)/FAD-dependent oxidoreductase [Clostridiales bacterium]|nr:NAD(P)/FAD-dependent oxidoreductase [Clostridiales bacterium]